ncbi:MAG: DUF3143 domain-containing protein [Cyanobacteria bacterium SW_9_44_58]|nr:MAG: DUF3143 domain-containing protein [Cyanobacteria bacterium SW_9_44_58]
MTFPSADTPLYNHPLPVIEEWLQSLGCQQDQEQLHCWSLQTPNWEAQIALEVEELTVSYRNTKGGNPDVTRSFPYSLSREDVEAAVLSGP